MTNFKDFLEEQLKDDEIRKEYEKLEQEMDEQGEIIMTDYTYDNMQTLVAVVSELHNIFKKFIGDIDMQ